MISNRDIVIISSIDWQFLWQGPQEIASRLAAAGNRILFVENLGIRAPTVGDLSRVGSRLFNWAKVIRNRGAVEVSDRIFVASPLVLPPFGSTISRWINRKVFLRPVIGIFRRLGMNDPIIWSFLPSDTALDLQRTLRTAKSTTIYYCAADFRQLAPRSARLAAAEETLVKASDLVFVHLPELRSRFAEIHPDVHLFPWGVDLDAFPIDPVARKPNAQPVIGYVGGIHRHVDVTLLENIVTARPDWRWVFVGPIQSDLGKLPAHPNVSLLGQQPHAELVQHLHSFDVCIVPYATNDYTDTVVPVKINEYLAAGKRIVATELPSVVSFNKQHNALFTAPAEPSAFLSALEEALAAPDDQRERQRRREVAALSDWMIRLEDMNALIECDASTDGRTQQNPP